MSGVFAIDIDTKGLSAWSKRTTSAVQRAAQMAGSSAVRAMRAEGSRLIRETKAMKAGQVSKALTISYPSSKDVLVWKVIAKAEVMPVIAFKGARQTRKGVSVEINVGRRVLIKGAFIATMKSGHTGVFMRTGKRRLPIREAYTTKVSEAFRDKIPAIGEKGRSVFASTFARVLPLEVAKRSAA